MTSNAGKRNKILSWQEHKGILNDLSLLFEICLCQTKMPKCRNNCLPNDTSRSGGSQQTAAVCSVSTPSSGLFLQLHFCAVFQLVFDLKSIWRKYSKSTFFWHLLNIPGENDSPNCSPNISGFYMLTITGMSPNHDTSAAILHSWHKEIRLKFWLLFNLSWFVNTRHLF